jgi:Papain family cysteine protease
MQSRGAMPHECSRTLHRPSYLLVALAACAVALAAPACKSKPAASKGPAAAVAPKVDDDDDDDDDAPKADPAVVNQKTGKGKYAAAKAPPPPVPRAVEKDSDSVFVDPPRAKLAAAPKPENGRCGEIVVAGQKIPLDCMDEESIKVKGSSKALVSDDDVGGGPGAPAPVLPKVVDHRKDGTEGPILNQGATLACTSFSLVAAVNHAVARVGGKPGNVSPMHAWARYAKPSMALAEQVNDGHPLASLAVFPFDVKIANDLQAGKVKASVTLMKNADDKGDVEITDISELETTPRAIKGALAAGQDVWFALAAAHGLQSLTKLSNGESIVPDYDWKDVPKSKQMGHAIVLAGYRETARGTYFLIHNSWGPAWGTNGYGWISEKTLTTNIRSAYTVDARERTASDTGAGPARPVANKAACKGDRLPDSVTAQCVPTCPEGGARSNGVCPVAGHCPDGQVNLKGSCVLAAPRLEKTLAGGIKLSCAPQGCVYAFPKGQAGCQKERCVAACPAPRFKLAHGPKGLVCRE